MLYLILFLEGILAFISPCILPMMPIYIMYLAGTKDIESSNSKMLVTNTLGFILGFTIIFVLMGATATLIGSILNDYSNILMRVSGIIIIYMGLSFLDITKVPTANLSKNIEVDKTNLNFKTSVLFGISFSICWSACLSTFLGSAFILASNEDTVIQGMLMLFSFSMGLAIPIFITALIADKLVSSFNFIKKHYNVIKLFSGAFLILIGLLLLFDKFDIYNALF